GWEEGGGYLLLDRHWNARYRWFAQVRRSLAVGIERGVIDAINSHGNPSLTNAREHICLVVARELLASKGLSDETYAAAEKSMGLQSLVALTASIGSFSMRSNRRLTTRHRSQTSVVPWGPWASASGFSSVFVFCAAVAAVPSQLQHEHTASENKACNEPLIAKHVPFAWLVWYFGPQMEMVRPILASISDPALRAALQEAHAERLGIWVAIWPVSLLVLSQILEKKMQE